MAIQARCPSCASVIRAADKYAGQRVKCPKCGGTIAVPAPAEPQEPAAAAPGAPAEAPAGAAAAAEASSLDQGVFAGAGAASEAQPFVNLGDDGAQRWKHVVSRSGRTRGRSRVPKWLWPAAGGVACVIALAVAVFVFTRSDEGAAPDAKVAKSSNQRPAADPDPDTESDDLADAEPAAMTAPRETRQPDASGEPRAAADDQPPSSSGSVALRDEMDDFPQESLDLPARSDRSGEPPQVVADAPGADGADESKPAEEMPPEPANEPDSTADASPDPETEAADANAGAATVALSPEDVLKKHSLRILGDRAVHTDEQKINEALDAAEKFRKDLRKANLEWVQWQKQLAAVTREMTLLRQQYGVINVRLAQVNASRPLDATTNNVLVGQAEAISTQIELRQQQHKQLTEGSDAARKRVSELREGFVQNVLDARKLTDTIQQVYDESGDEVQRALEKLAQASGDDAYALEPSRTFARNIRELESLEEQILSDTIEVRDQGGNLYVTVVINGKHTQEMVVDSGATIVLLPYTMAEEVGLKPDANAPELRLELADGNTITGRAITIPSLRVGRFTAENVEAAVLGPEARSATPLLGMSFLGQYRFEIDNARGLLKLVEVDKPETPRAR